MGKIQFYVLWSLRDAPRQFINKSDRRHFQVHVPLPLPKQLVIFGLGEWEGTGTTISVDVLIAANVQAQRIGTLTFQARCLTWEGDWRADIVTVAAERGRKGACGKILLTVCGEDKTSILSSTPVAQRKCLFPDQQYATGLSGTLYESTVNETITTNCSHLVDSVCDAEIQVGKMNTLDSKVVATAPIWLKDRAPRQTVMGRGLPTCSYTGMRSSAEEMTQGSMPKKMKLSSMNSLEEMTVQIKNENRHVCPSGRWSHTMCQIDRDTAMLIGGEATNQIYCQDSLWKLKLDSDFWFPMNSSVSGPVPPCARGHSATYDPDSKAVFVYGGLREIQRYSELHILNTLTWTWRLVTARGSIPTMSYHSAAFYERELFIFGGVQPSHHVSIKSCSDVLYTFNPEFELWYQPLVEGNRPLPRFGHSATLLSHKMIIFGGTQPGSYLNDLHVLDLGFMEYTAVKCGNMPPLPRGFHAALPVSDNRILISGGCSRIGVLHDVYSFNIDTCMWTSLVSPALTSKPRAGHSMINLSIQTETHEQEGCGRVKTHCILLVFGGANCAGTFYNDSVKCIVEIPGDE